MAEITACNANYDYGLVCPRAIDPNVYITDNYGWLKQDPADFHFDIGTAKVLVSLDISNCVGATASASETAYGVQNFTLWGTNDVAVYNLLDSGDTGWTQLSTNPTVLARHGENQDPEYQQVAVATSTAYRYYRIHPIDNYGGSSGGVGLRMVIAHTAGQKLWLKADDLALTDGDPVDTWTDASGSLNDFTQTGATRPIYKINRINGMPAVTSDGTQWLENAAFNGLPVLAIPRTVIIVTQPNGKVVQTSTNLFGYGTWGGSQLFD
jgi:hypothetical protein